MPPVSSTSCNCACVELSADATAFSRRTLEATGSDFVIRVRVSMQALEQHEYNISLHSLFTTPAVHTDRLLSPLCQLLEQPCVD